jgi:hypothetical protein
MNSSVYDLTIQNNEIFSTGYGIHVRSDANSQTSSEEYTASTYGTVIQGNIVNSTLDGICVEADAYDTAHVYDLTIQNNKISSQINGIFVYAYADWTRYEADIHHVLVGNNQISSQANGIQICAGGWSESHIHGIAVENNIVESSHYDGVYIHAEALGEADIYDVLVRNNLVSSSVNGIHIRVDIAYSMGGLSSYVYNINIQDNRVFSCSKTGLTIEPSHYVQKFAYDASVTNNVFSSMVDTGILIKWITTNTTRNYIFNNSYGIKYEGTSGNSAQFNDIYQNSLFGMTVANGATVNAENNFWGNETGPHSESVNPEGSGDIVNGNGIDLDFIPWLSSSVLSHALIPSWVRVGTQAEYSLTNPKNTSETAVWKWDIISVTADRIEVLHTFEKLWGIPDPDYPAVFKSIVDPSTGGIVNVVPMDKMLPPGYSVPFVTLFTLWVPSNMSANDSAHVIGPYGADYPPAPVLRFENVSSPLEKEECVAVGFEIEKGDPETDLWDYNVYTNSLVKFYMNWPSYEVEELVMLKQWIVTAPQPNQPPVSSFNYSPVSPVHSGSMVSFDASGSYDPEGRAISYEWNFGDGETATGRTVSYRFRGAIVDAQTHVPRTKNYIITLTVRDDKGATDTESASLTVEPLRKTINLDPGYFGVSCWMEAVYNWVGTDEATGENLYIISRIDTYSGGISGAYQLFILRRMSPPPSIPKVVWHIPLPTMPILRTYATPFTPSLWQKLWGTTCDLTTLIFPDGTFEGIGVTDTSLMLIVATGTETGITAYYDLGTVKFEPGSPVVHLKPEELKELSELKDILDLLNKIIGIIGSPGELRVYDSEGRVTGLVNGEIKEEIPGSACANGSIMILYPNQTYRYEVVGTENGTYKLLITAVENVNATTFVATEIPTLSNETHQYTIDWAALVRGEEGVTVQVDSDGDGVYEATFASDSELTASEFIPEFQAFSTFLLILVAATVTVMALRRKRAKTRRT